MTVPRALEERLRAGKVIPFVGTGISRSVKCKDDPQKPLFPNWHELLEAAAERLDAEAKVSDAEYVRSCLRTDPKKYLEAAEHAQEKLKSTWHDFLREKIDCKENEADFESLALAKAVWDLGSKLIITTNYDPVMKWTSPKPSELVVWDIQAPAEQARALQDGVSRHTLWHLHGHICNTSKIILAPNGYNLLYPVDDTAKDAYKAAFETLRSFLASHTFLFIGYSMDDCRFVEHLRDVHNIFEGATGPHYVLAHDDECSDISQKVGEIEVLPFPDFGEPLLEIMSNLGNIVSNMAPTGTDTQTDFPNLTKSDAADYDPRKFVFHVPYRSKGEQVIGRGRALQELREQLLEERHTSVGHAAAFEGIGGLGKTQLAVEYAYKYRDEYPNGVLWLNADQDIAAQLIQIADKARWIAPQSDHKVKYEIAIARLRNYSNCLIIFDNLRDREEIEEYLPEPQAEPHIIVTSRIDQPGFFPVPLDPLDEKSSLELLLQEAGRKPDSEYEWSAADGIVDALGGLPLALELAGAYLRFRGQSSWQSYYDLLSCNLQSALNNNLLDSFTKHDRDLFSTLKVDDEILNAEPQLRDILDILTWSARASMGLSLMCAMLDVHETSAIKTALDLGVELRLIKKQPQKERYELHPLVLEVRRLEIPLSEDVDFVDTVCKRLGDWFEQHRQNFADLPAFEADIDHLFAWLRNAERLSPEHTPRLVWLQAYPPYHWGKYRDAKSRLEDAFQRLSKFPNPDPAMQAHLHNDIGTICIVLGEHELGLKQHGEALKIRKALYGEKHPDTAFSINNMGSAYGHACDFERAFAYHKKALGISRELHGDKNSNTARFLNDLGTAYYQGGNYAKALELGKKALDISKDLNGEKHPETAQYLNSVGNYYANSGEHAKALEYTRNALEICIELFGEEHPTTARYLSDVGSAYSNHCDHEMALQYKKKALRIDKSLFGEHHPSTARCLGDVGVTYANLGKHKDALKIQEKTLRIRRELHGYNHPDTATSLCNIGACLLRMGDHDGAQKHLKQAADIRREKLGDCHPDTIETVYQLGNLLFRLGRGSKARPMLHNFLKNLPKDHPEYSRLAKLKKNPPKSMKKKKQGKK